MRRARTATGSIVKSDKSNNIRVEEINARFLEGTMAFNISVYRLCLELGKGNIFLLKESLNLRMNSQRCSGAHYFIYRDLGHI
jgi:hypothetical protein